MTKEQSWIVTTSGDRPLAEVARELSAAGFTVRQHLEDVGIISGSGRPDVAEKLRSIRGVTDVSEDHPIDIGPPGGPVTW